MLDKKIIQVVLRETADRCFLACSKTEIKHTSPNLNRYVFEFIGNRDRLLDINECSKFGIVVFKIKAAFVHSNHRVAS